MHEQGAEDVIESAEAGDREPPAPPRPRRRYGWIVAGSAFVFLVLVAGFLFTPRRTLVPERWEKAVIAADGRSVTVTFEGAVKTHPSDACASDYETEAVDRGDHVEVSVRRVDEDPLVDLHFREVTCTANLVFSDVVVALPDALAGRPLTDPNSRRVPEDHTVTQLS